MRLAFISYEYPTDIGWGGIATYVLELSKMMNDAGFDVEIFTGSFTRSGLFEENGIMINIIQINDVDDFAVKVVEVFGERHRIKPFDLYETPEINANAYNICKQFQQIPFVTKLHTPVTLQLKLFNYYQPWASRLRFVFGALRRGRIDWGYWRRHDPHPENDRDYVMTVLAKAITAPSEAMKKWATNYWKIQSNRITVLENPYSPSKVLLSQHYKSDERKYITFIGKLNIHKGMLVLTKALPSILLAFPFLKMRFIAKDGPSHIKGLSMKEYMQTELRQLEDRVEFTGAVTLTEIPGYLNEAKICIFPSIWEAFGYVVLEAMSAGVPVAVSKNSGMQEIVNNGECGLLFNALSPKDVTKQITDLLHNHKQLENLSIAGRKRVLKNYTPQVLAGKYSKFYQSILL